MTRKRNSLAIDVDNLVVDVASKGRHAARIPDTPERQRLERQRSIREIVFGAQDGVLTTLGIVSGLGGATTDRATILLTGFLSLLVGAISMGVGEFLGGKAEREVVQNAIAFERQEMIDTPDEEYAEQLAYYRLKGFTDDEAHIIVARLAKNPEIWLHEMVRDEFGIDLREAEGGSLGSAVSMCASFAIGAALPVVPYLFPVSHLTAMFIGFALAAIALFTIGAFAGRLTRTQPARQGPRNRRVRRRRLRHLICGGALHPDALRSRFDQPRRLIEKARTRVRADTRKRKMMPLLLLGDGLLGGRLSLGLGLRHLGGSLRRGLLLHVRGLLAAEAVLGRVSCGLLRRGGQRRAEQECAKRTSDARIFFMSTPPFGLSVRSSGMKTAALIKRSAAVFCSKRTSAGS